MTTPTATGRILRIEKLSSFDGDGLRTVVFLKGCPLRCQWCSTPESQRNATDFGVSRSKCVGCFSCVDACPEKALTYDIRKEQFVNDMDTCREGKPDAAGTCQKCVHACPNDARMGWGYLATAQEILKEVSKDSIFYYHSGGGVTVSGGEPLMQSAFVRELLEEAVMQGINTAIETCGHIPFENIQPVLPFVDTLFYDLKHMDNHTHKQLVQTGNRLILENLERIDASAPGTLSIIVRMPVIPTVNDQDDNIKALGEFCRNLTKLKQIQLLPYHRLGMETYNRMSIPYTLKDLETPSEPYMDHKLKRLTDMGLPAQIGS